MAAKRKRKYEFKPDPSGTNFWKKFYMTRLQRLTLLKWTLYSLLCVALLVIQDSMLSRMHLWGATTDLAAAVILLIGIHEGAENGGLFTLIASAVYWFSGSAPAPYAIVILTFLVVGVSLLRQMFWRRFVRFQTWCAKVLTTTSTRRGRLQNGYRKTYTTILMRGRTAFLTNP